MYAGDFGLLELGLEEAASDKFS
jgi:hypothetical protein